MLEGTEGIHVHALHLTQRYRKSKVVSVTPPGTAVVVLFVRQHSINFGLDVSSNNRLPT